MTPSNPSIACDPADSGADLALHKRDQRQRLLALRKAQPADVRNAASRAIGGHLLAWMARHGTCSPPTLAVYWPIRGEPDLQESYLELARRGVQLALPVVVAADAPLAFATWQPGQPMAQDSFGVAIPAEPRTVVVPDTILIPCVGVSPHYYRLGYGGGMYDRTLAQWPAASTVGIAFDCARAQFAIEAHDIRLQYLITESGVSSLP